VQTVVNDSSDSSDEAIATTVRPKRRRIESSDSSSDEAIATTVWPKRRRIKSYQSDSSEDEFLVAIARRTTRQNQPVQNDGAVASTSSSAAQPNRLPIAIELLSDSSDSSGDFVAKTPRKFENAFGEVVVHNSTPPTLTDKPIREELPIVIELLSDSSDSSGDFLAPTQRLDEITFGEILVHNSPPPMLTEQPIREELFIPTSDEDIKRHLPIQKLHRTQATVQRFPR
jgi:hypothetical protein